MSGSTLSVAVVSLLLVVMVVSSSHAFGDDEGVMAESVGAFQKSYCLDCHSAEQPEAMLDLSIFEDASDIAKRHQTWQELDFITSAPMRQYQGFVWFERTDSHGLRPSPVKRGYWVVRQMLGEHIPAPPPPNVPDFPVYGNAGSFQTPFSSRLAGCGIPVLNGISVTHDRSRLHPAPAVQYNAGQFEMRNSCPILFSRNTSNKRKQNL